MTQNMPLGPNNARCSIERFTASEILPSISVPLAGWWNNADVRKTSALQLPRNGGMSQEFRAVSIHPRSEIRALLVYLDDETWPRAVVAGQVLRVKFRQVRIEPLEDAARGLGNVAGFVDAISGGAAPISCQLGALVLWIDDPCVGGFSVGNRVQVVQDLSAAVLAPGGGTVAHVLTGGAISATVSVTNRNTTNPANLDHYVFQAEPAVRGTSTPAPYSAQFQTAAATLNLPATASANLAASTTITNPASSIIVTQASSASSGAWRTCVVVSLLFPQGAA